MNITILRMRAAAVLVFGGLATWVPYGALADTMEMEPDKYSALKAFADRRLSETKVPGAGVGIVKDGKVIFAGGFGTRDLNTGEPVNSQTAYLIGSSTKPFTVTAIAILAQEGILDWDERVRTYMPSFKFKDEYVSEHLTLRDLGSHRSGVSKEPDWMGSTLSRTEMIESMSDYELSAGFREKFQYHGAGFMILGHMATLASGTKFEDVVLERICEPLGLENTIWSDLSGPNPPYKENVAYPHTVEWYGKARRIDFIARRGCSQPLRDNDIQHRRHADVSAIPHPEGRTQWQATIDGREPRRTHHAKYDFQLRRGPKSREARRLAGTVRAGLVAGKLQRSQRRASRRFVHWNAVADFLHARQGFRRSDVCECHGFAVR